MNIYWSTGLSFGSGNIRSVSDGIRRSPRPNSLHRICDRAYPHHLSDILPHALPPSLQVTPPPPSSRPGRRRPMLRIWMVPRMSEPAWAPSASGSFPRLSGPVWAPSASGSFRACLGPCGHRRSTAAETCRLSNSCAPVTLLGAWRRRCARLRRPARRSLPTRDSRRFRHVAGGVACPEADFGRLGDFGSAGNWGRWSELG